MSERENYTSEIYVVTGLGIGEETKASAVEWLASEMKAHTILRSGGSQAGHHVVLADGTEQMFSHFGAGTFERAKTHLKHMVINPADLFTEAMELEAKGVEKPFDLLTIDEDCLTVTPFNGAFSRLKEILRDDKKGTVGKGVGDAMRDDSERGLGIHAGNFKDDEETLRQKVETIRQHKLHQAAEMIQEIGIEELPDEVYSEMKILHDTRLVDLTVESFKAISDLVQIVDDSYTDELLLKEGAIVCEPSHGALLHPRHGFVPHVTQIDPTSQDVLATIKEKNYKGKIVRLGVSRCYMTRHGAGPLVSYSPEMTESIKETHNAGNERANEWLGEFRSGQYDIVAMKYAIDISGGKESFDGLKISYMDVLRECDEWQVCNAYSYEGDADDLNEYFVIENGLITGIRVHPDDGGDAHYNHQLRLTQLLKECKPVLRTLTPQAGGSLEDVFLNYVEAETELPVVAVSYGPKKEDRHVRRGWEHMFSKAKTKNKLEIVDLQVKHSEIYRPLGIDLYYAGQEIDLERELVSNPKLIKEAIERRELYRLISEAFNKVEDPNIAFDQAIQRGLIDKSEVDVIYQKLADFITKDENNGRIILYLPPQILSNSNSQFVTAYKDAWLRLMHESEPRANYIDGDILEPGMGDLARIRKAGHLIPDMLEHGLIDLSEVYELLKVNNDPEFHNSLIEGLSVAQDRNDYSSADIKIKEPIDFQAQLADIESQYSPESLYVATISTARAKWEKQVRIDEILNAEAEIQARNVQRGVASVEDVSKLHPDVFVKTLVKVGESLANTNQEEAIAFVEENKSVIEKLWKGDSITTKNEIVTALSYWSHLKIIDSSYLNSFGVKVPDLSDPFPVNLESEEFVYLSEVATKIESHPELSEYLYPIVVAVGSRVKGQAELSADYDGGVLFKPETPTEKREYVLNVLRRDVPEFSKIEKPIEFWIKHDENGFNFRDDTTHIKSAVNPSQVHFVINGIWVSRAPELKMIQNDLLKKYLDLSRFGEQKEDVRRQLLRQIELDILQYRLMHKGYRQFYPSHKLDGSEYANLIDWNSDYWDPGYRRIATQLFLSRVFLPDLSM